MLSASITRGRVGPSANKRTAISSGRRRSSKRIKASTSSFVMSTTIFFCPKSPHALRALDVPMLNYNVDMTNQWYRQIRTARYFTGMLCAQRVHMSDLARYGAPVYYFPMAARAPVFVDDQGIRHPSARDICRHPDAISRCTCLGASLRPEFLWRSTEDFGTKV